MARDTPRFGLDDFEIGDRGWDHSDLVQFVDTHSIARGPVGDRPTQGTYPDELYLATDDQTLYRWDADADTWRAAIRAGVSDGDDFDGHGEAAFTNLHTVEASEIRSTAQTIYVRSDGDDANDGLSAPDAKATPQAAADDAPLHLDGGQPLVIKIGSGTFGPLDLEHIAASRSILVQGTNDSNGNPASVLDGGDTATPLDSTSAVVRCENLAFQNGPWANVRAYRSGSVELANCELHGGPNVVFNARAVGGSFMRVRDGCAFDWSQGADSSSSHLEVIAGHGRIDAATLTGGGQATSGSVVSAKQSAYIELYGTVLENNDAGRDCLRLRDGTDAKIGPGGASMLNASNGIAAERNCDVTDKSDGGVTFTNISSEEYRLRGASYAQNYDGTEAWAFPTNSAATDVESAFGSAMNLLHFNQSIGHPEAYHPSEDDWLVMGQREIESGTVNVPANGETDVDLGAVGAANVNVVFGPTAGAGGVVSYQLFESDAGNLMVRFVNDGSSGGDWYYTVYEMPTP